MNLEDLRTEFLARGFDYLPSSRADNFLNDAYLLDICEEEDWPFLEAVAEGPAPLVIEDLRTVEYVINSTQKTKLTPLRAARITDDWNPDLTQTGTPELYYITGGNTIQVFPVNTDSLTVLYWKAPPRLTGTATPLLPERFHSLIVDAAVVRAYTDSDDYELAEAAQRHLDNRLRDMAESLENLQHDAPDDYVVVEDPAALR